MKSLITVLLLTLILNIQLISCFNIVDFLNQLFKFQKPVYKLTYFNIKGRSEFLRFIFAQAGQEYTDFRIQNSDLPNLKPTFPFEELPVLEVQKGNENLIIAQSLTIARYLARQLNLNGRNPTETTLIDMYGSQVADLFNSINAIIIINQTQASFHEAWNKNLKFFEKRLEINGNGYLVGNSLSWADLYLSQMTDFLFNRKSELLSNYPRIKALDDRVRSFSRIADWLRRRPVTDF
nr:glutathione S-transferase GSTS6/7-4 [Brachionus angularis]